MRAALAWLLLAGCGNGANAPLPDFAVPDLSSPGCTDPPAQWPDAGACVRTVSGKVVDEGGAPLPNLVMSVCAVACYFGKTAADGTFTVAVDAHLQLDEFALLIHGKPRRATYYIRLPAPVGDTITYPSPLPLYALPTSGPAILTDRSPQTLTAGDVTLALPAGTGVQFDVEDVLAGALGESLRPLAFPDPKQMPFVDPSAPPDALYAFSPFDVVFSQKATLTFQNVKSLPAGAAVDVQAMGGLLGGSPPAGNFATVATAHVSADGKTIAMDPGQGVRGLTWVALRKR